VNHKPVAISLILCEQVIVDERSHNATPVNCFNTRLLEDFPGQATFYAVAWLTDGIGDMSVEVVVERMDSLEEVFRLDRHVQFANPLDEMCFIIPIRDCDLPIPGAYQVSLSIDRELIAHCKFIAAEQGE
jgi:hypothetical protein